MVRKKEFHRAAGGKFRSGTVEDMYSLEESVLQELEKKLDDYLQCRRRWVVEQVGKALQAGDRMDWVRVCSTLGRELLGERRVRAGEAAACKEAAVFAQGVGRVAKKSKIFSVRDKKQMLLVGVQAIVRRERATDDNYSDERPKRARNRRQLLRRASEERASPATYRCLRVQTSIQQTADSDHCAAGGQV